MLVVFVAVVLHGLVSVSASTARVELWTAVQDDLEPVTTSCGSQSPYFFASCFFPASEAIRSRNETAIVAFNASRLKVEVAEQADLGSVYGLAFDPRENALYSAAYHKAATTFGPGGPGAVYRTDLATGESRVFASLDAGPDEHQFVDRDPWSDRSQGWVGRTSLGDIDLDADSDTLYVTNMRDRRIYAVSAIDGSIMGSMAHGASDQDWSENARLFGLGVRDGWIYHGVVDSREDSHLPGEFAAYIYRSRPGGVQMEEVTQFPLDYPRSPTWTAWTPIEDSSIRCNQPVISDIEFRPDDSLILGLRDMGGDAQCGGEGGDLLPTRRDPSGLKVVVDPEWYKDETTHRESVWGGLAMSHYRDVVVASALDPDFITSSGGALWFENATGERKGSITLYRTPPRADGFGKAQGLGDVEAVCPPSDVVITLTPSATVTSTVTPSLTVTASPPPLTPTVLPSRTSATPTLSPEPTTPTPSPTWTETVSPSTTPREKATATPIASEIPGATPARMTAYLPLTLLEFCPPPDVYTDVALVIDASTSMRETTRDGRTKLAVAQVAAQTFIEGLRLTAGGDRVAIISFNEYAYTLQSLTSERSQLDAAISHVRISQFSRLDLGVEQAAIELLAGARSDAMPALIVLSDGRANPVPGEHAVSVNNRIRDAGIATYVVGMGPVMDEAVLRAMAGSEERFFPAPDPLMLRAIYSGLTKRVPCAPELYWAGR